MAKKLGEAIRDARKQSALTQEELAAKLDVTQATVSTWETGRQEPGEDSKAKLQSILGSNFLAASRDDADASSVLSAWLSKARQQQGMTIAQLAERSGLAVPTIYNIEAGKAQNP